LQCSCGSAQLRGSLLSRRARRPQPVGVNLSKESMAKPSFCDVRSRSERSVKNARVAVGRWRSAAHVATKPLAMGVSGSAGKRRIPACRCGQGSRHGTMRTSEAAVRCRAVERARRPSRRGFGRAGPLVAGLVSEGRRPQAAADGLIGRASQARASRRGCDRPRARARTPSRCAVREPRSSAPRRARP
jgi:hypothetical protein